MALKRNRHLKYKVPRPWKSGKIAIPLIPTHSMKPESAIKDLTDVLGY
jgi:hypothetical protein